MTVAQALAHQCGFKVFHNHMTIDLLTEFFEYGSTPFGNLVGSFRRDIVREAAKADVDLIFTYVWALDDASDKRFIDGLTQLVEGEGGECFYAELEAGLSERLERNRSEHRLKHKKKADVEATERQLLDAEARYQLNTDGEFFYPDRHVKVDNNNLSPEDCARRIASELGFAVVARVPLL